MVLFFIFFLSGLSWAQVDSRFLNYLAYKKFIIEGNVTFGFVNRDIEREFNGAVTKFSSHTFTQDYGLALTSYVLHPKLLTYTAAVNWRILSGSGGETQERRYALDMDFLKTKPFNFSLRTDYLESRSADQWHGGVSMSYTVSDRLQLRTMRELTIYNNMQRANMRNNNQRNYYQNNNNWSNENENEKYDNEELRNYRNENYDNENYYDRNKNNNIYNNLRRTSAGYVKDSIWPDSYYFDYDHYSTDYAEGTDSTADHSSFRLLGGYNGETFANNYWLSLGYMKFDNSYGYQRYMTEFRDLVHFQNSDDLRLQANYDVKKYDQTDGQLEDVDLLASYTGSFDQRRWRYGISTLYNSTGIVGDFSRYSVNGFVASGQTIGRLHTGYRFGAFYDSFSRVSNDNYGAEGSFSADTRITPKTTMLASTNVSAGSAATSYGLRVESRYVRSRNQTYMGAYDFSTLSGTNAQQYGGGRRVETRHEFMLGTRLNGWGQDLSSMVTYALYNTGNTLNWNNVYNTTIYYRVRFTLGLSYTRNEVTGLTSHSDFSRVSIYNIMSGKPTYNSILRLYTSYDRVLDGFDSDVFSTEPSLSFIWRKLYMTASYRYSIDKTNNLKITEHKVNLQLSRPFWL